MTTPLLRYSEAAELVRQFLRDLPAASDFELAPLTQASGRVLAQEIRADRDQPPFPRSTRDGFACRAAEAGSHQLLNLSGQIRAGETPLGTLNTGEAWEIMTGAPIPPGADAVFMVEHSEASSSAVRLMAPRQIAAGDNIIPQGAEAHAGDSLVPSGIRLGPAQIAMAAQCGCSQLSVVRQPRVAILATGDELVAVQDTPGPSQIRNSNAPMLAALVTAAGGVSVILPTAPDEDAALDAVLKHAFAADLLLVSGGISAGRFDLVEGALSRVGAQFLFRGVAMQPGKPIVFGQLPRAGKATLPFFALPGNPISSAVTFSLFAAPIVAALAGNSAPYARFALARLAGEWHGKPGLTRILPAICSFGIDPEVRLIPWQGSGDIAAFARSNCFVMIPDNAAELADGSPVTILPT